MKHRLRFIVKGDRKNSAPNHTLAYAEDIAFGPVVSRRLGQSLGVNTVPCKTCAYSCVYCQLGPTRCRTMTRRAYFDAESVAAVVEHKVGRARTRPDFVTFLGCGEPTLAANLGECLESVKRIWSGRTALLTSGALFSRPDVREEAMAFDIVMPTVATGNASLFRLLHHPHPKANFNDVVRGLEVFSDQFEGQFLPEVMLVEGMNDTEERLQEIKEVLQTMRVDGVHVTAPVRAPTQKWVHPPQEGSVALALGVLPSAVDFTRPERAAVTEIIGIMVDELLGIASMHPLTEDQAVSALREAGASEEEALELLSLLVESSKMVKNEYRGRSFYRTRK